MPEFDVVNQVDLQEVDNAINNARQMVAQRYDFRNSNTEIDLDKKNNTIKIVTADEMKMKALEEILTTSLIRRKLDPKSLKYGEIEPTSGGNLKREAKLQTGIDADTTKKIAKWIKETKLKVQVKIQGEQVRVNGKKIDDLQTIISLLKEKDLDVPLQFVNMKR